jgi:hypothetical protein
VDHRQRHLALFDVDAQRFADRGRVADDVEDVVLDLERGAEREAVSLKLRRSRSSDAPRNSRPGSSTSRRDSRS